MHFRPAVLLAITLMALLVARADDSSPPRFVRELEKAARARPSHDRSVCLAWVAWALAETGERARAKALSNEAVEAVAGEAPFDRARALGRAAAVADRVGESERAQSLFADAFDSIASSGSAAWSYQTWSTFLAVLDAFADVRAARRADPLADRAWKIFSTAAPKDNFDLGPVVEQLRRLGFGDRLREVFAGPLNESGQRFLELDPRARCYALLYAGPLPETARRDLVASIEALDSSETWYRLRSVAEAALRGDAAPLDLARRLADHHERRGHEWLGIEIRLAALQVACEERGAPRADLLFETLDRIRALKPESRQGTALRDLVVLAPELAPNAQGVAFVASIAHVLLAEREGGDGFPAMFYALGKLPRTDASLDLARMLVRTALERTKDVRDSRKDGDLLASIANNVGWLAQRDPKIASDIAEAALAIARANRSHRGDTGGLELQAALFISPCRMLAGCARAASLRGDQVAARELYEASLDTLSDPGADASSRSYVLISILKSLTGIDPDVRNEVGVQSLRESEKDTTNNGELFFRAAAGALARTP